MADSLRDQAESIVASDAGGGLDDLRGDYKRKVQTEQKKSGLNPLLVIGPALGQAFDAYSTQEAMKKGAAEANPVMEPFARNPAAMYATKVGIGALEGLLADRLSRSGHPTAAKIVSALNISLPIGAGIHNMQLAGKR